MISGFDYLNPNSDNFIIKDILSFINPFSENFILKPANSFFGSVLNWLNPFSEDFFLKKVINNIGSILDYLNPFSENFFLKDFFNWFGNFFTSLSDFFLHIFIPTNDQWNEIKNDYTNMGDTVKAHIPFVGLFSEELKKAQATVEKTDFLVINMPSFSYSGSGGIGVNSNEQKVINVGQAYEPYRAYIRGGLLLIVVGLAFVYIIKYILYGNIQRSDSGKE